MVNMDAWLARKYDILGEQARSQDLVARSQANLTDTQASVLPGETRARNQAALGSAAASFGQGNLANANAAAVPQLSSAEVAQRRGAADLSGAQASGVVSELAPNPSVSGATISRLSAGAGWNPVGGVTPSLSLSTSPEPVAIPGAPTNGVDPQYDYSSTTGGYVKHLSTGTAKVPGAGDGTVDTQAAMLAPGEAVLNKAAAEHLGRTTIELLNAIGEQKMGMAGGQATEDDRAQSANDPKNGYAKGTSKVPAKGASGKGDGKASGKPAGGKGAKPGGDASAQISPKLLAALMQGGGGAGMPAAGGQPMPMPMPQVAPPQGGM